MKIQRLLIFLCLFISIFKASSYTNNGTTKTLSNSPGYQIRDLQQDTITSDSLSWTNTSTQGTTLVYNCSGDQMLGGYGIINRDGSVSRTYSGLVTHDYFYLQLTFWRLDSWNLDDSVLIQIDENFFTFRLEAMPYVAGYSNVCGNSLWGDYMEMKILVGYYHIMSDITITFASRMNRINTEGSFGISDIILNFANVGNGASDIRYAYGPILPNRFTTAVNYPNFKTSDACDSSCSTCMGPSPTDCIQCADGYYYSGTTCLQCHFSCQTCSNADSCIYPKCPGGNFIYWNEACLPTCPSPLNPKSLGGTGYCEYNCSDSQSIYWDGICESSCPHPLISYTIEGKQLCRSPCTPGLYLYNNGSCLPTCDTYLADRNRDGYLLCTYTCANTQFLYYNTSCLEVCNYPLRASSVGTDYYCLFPCSNQSDFLYYNQSCSPTCNEPLTPRIEGGRKFCDYSCSYNTSLFLYWNYECLGFCNLPAVQNTWGGKKFCTFTCSNSNDYMYWNGSCISDCPSPLVQKFYKSRNFCEYPCLGIDWLYWNGSCMSDCPVPLRKNLIAGNRFCEYVCTDPADYSYWNGSCLPDCSFPLKPSFEGDKKFCNFPCNSSDYVYWNGICRPQCVFPFIAEIILGNYYCKSPCNNTVYTYWNSTCSTECKFPLFQSSVGGDPYCDFPCLRNQFLYDDGSCNFICFKPYKPITVGMNKFCVNPCANNEFLYWNSACMSDCPIPLINTTSPIKLCKNPCLSNEFILPNGTCISKCEAPKAIVDKNQARFCQYPCNNSKIINFLGECVTNCTSPFIKQKINNDFYCDSPCSQKEFFFPNNNSCLEYCSKPYTSILEGENLQCRHPCSNKKNFLFDNGTCLPNCDFPFSPYIILDDVLICKYECDAPFIEKLGVCQCPKGYNINLGKTSCDVSGNLGLVIESFSKLNSVITVGLLGFILLDVSPTLMISIMDHFQNIYFMVFINVNYPILVNKFNREFHIFTISFLPNTLELIFDRTEKETNNLRVYEERSPDAGSDLESPAKFMFNHFSGYFFQSAGPVVGAMMIFLLISLFFKILTKYVETQTGIFRFATVVASKLSELGLLRFWLIIFNKLTITSLLQLEVIDFSEPRFLLSSVFALLTMIINLSLPMIIAYIIRKETKVFDKEKYSKNMITKDFSPAQFLSQYFFVILLVKKILFGFGLVHFYYIPALQNIVPLTNHTLNAGLYFFLQPYLSKAHNLVNGISSTGFILLHLITMIFAFDDVNAFNLTSDTKEDWGLVFVIISIVMAYVMVAITLYSGIKESFFKVKRIMARRFSKSILVTLRTSKLVPILKTRPSQVKMKKVSIK